MNNIKLLSLFIVLFLAMGFGKHKLPLYYSFYKDQTYNAFILSVKEDLANLKEPVFSTFWDRISKDKADVDFDRDRYRDHTILKSLFEAKVLQNHPEYITPYMYTYETMGLYEKAAFLRALRMLGIELNQEITNTTLYELVADPNLFHISHYDAICIESYRDRSDCHICFTATGDEKYAVKIIEYFQKELEKCQSEVQAHYALGTLRLYMQDPYFKEIARRIIFTDSKFEALQNLLISWGLFGSSLAHNPNLAILQA